MTDRLIYAVEDRVATLTLHRPEKRNALDAALVGDLKAALDEAATSEAVRVVVLTGAGETFSAGADLASLQAMQTASPLENLADSQHLAGLFEQLVLHPKPIIAKINGHAIAGGCGLAAACDFSIATSQARLGFTEVRLGFVPAIVAVFVLRKLGEAAARDLLLRGGLVSAEAACAKGLITQVVAPEDLDEAVHTLAHELVTQTSASAIALTKRLLAEVPGMGLHAALAYAAQTNAFARGTPDCQAGIAAFLARKDPPWRSAS